MRGGIVSICEGIVVQLIDLDVILTLEGIERFVFQEDDAIVDEKHAVFEELYFLGLGEAVVDEMIAGYCSDVLQSCLED